jgi:hypothetical protein
MRRIIAATTVTISILGGGIAMADDHFEGERRFEAREARVERRQAASRIDVEHDRRELVRDRESYRFDRARLERERLERERLERERLERERLERERWERERWERERPHRW